MDGAFRPMIHDLGYNLQSVCRSREGTSHPDCNAQFELINATAAAFLHDRQPLISIDTNTMEHRLFCHITQNWRGKPLRTFETLVALIGHTRTATGLGVKAKLDPSAYPTGVVLPARR